MRVTDTVYMKEHVGGVPKGIKEANKNQAVWTYREKSKVVDSIFNTKTLYRVQGLESRPSCSAE